MTPKKGLHFNWRYLALLLLTFLPLLLILGQEPISQDNAYHNFVDSRGLFGIPNILDVVSNLPFLIVGVLGIRHCWRSDIGPMRNAWLVLFVGISLVSLGSAYYHWSPDSDSLVWDRLPMTIGFMGLLAALFGEFLDSSIGSKLLPVLILVGLASVLYWVWLDDLRPYLWVQFAPLIILPFLMLLFKSRYTHSSMLLLALFCYALAKLAEFYDVGVFQSTGSVVSGHSIKHLLAAAGCYGLLVMLQKRAGLDGSRGCVGNISSMTNRYK